MRGPITFSNRRHRQEGPRWQPDDQAWLVCGAVGGSPLAVNSAPPPSAAKPHRRGRRAPGSCPTPMIPIGRRLHGPSTAAGRAPIVLLAGAPLPADAFSADGPPRAGDPSLLPSQSSGFTVLLPGPLRFTPQSPVALLPQRPTGKTEYMSILPDCLRPQACGNATTCP